MVDTIAAGGGVVVNKVVGGVVDNTIGGGVDITIGGGVGNTIGGEGVGDTIQGGGKVGNTIAGEDVAGFDAFGSIKLGGEAGEQSMRGNSRASFSSRLQYCSLTCDFGCTSWK